MMKKKIQHKIEALLLRGFFAFLRLLSLDTTSALGGRLTEIIGPRLKAHKTAKTNIQTFLPELSESERAALLKKMWNNLGRVTAELAHLNKGVITKRITHIGKEHMPPADKPALFISGHLGNWELLPPASHLSGHPVTLVYRKANNPYVDAFINNIRSKWAGNMFPKGPTGAVKMARAIKNSETIAMLVDQKMNDGIAVPFFGVNAMTAPAVAGLALRYDLPIIPARVIRTGGVHFEVITYPAIEIEKTGDAEKDTLAIMTAVNKTLESWIRERPDQWFWVHQRWPKA